MSGLSMMGRLEHVGKGPKWNEFLFIASQVDTARPIKIYNVMALQYNGTISFGGLALAGTLAIQPGIQAKATFHRSTEFGTVELEVAPENCNEALFGQLFKRSSTRSPLPSRLIPPENIDRTNLNLTPIPCDAQPIYRFQALVRNPKDVAAG